MKKIWTVQLFVLVLILVSVLGSVGAWAQSLDLTTIPEYALPNQAPVGEEDTRPGERLDPPGTELQGEEQPLDLPEYRLPDAETAATGALRFVLAALVVAVALYGFYYLMKRLSGQGVRAVSSRYMTLLDTFTLRSTCTLYLVQVGDRILLIGQSGNTIQELAEFGSEDLTETIRKEPFVNYLDIWFRKKGQS